jgi:hypothetical protein
MRSATPTGSSPGDWTSVNLFARGGSGTFWKSSLHQIDGAPAIAWSDLSGLNYSRSLTADGMIPGQWTTAPIGPVSGLDTPSTEHASLAIVDGKPAMAFWFNDSRSCLGFALSSSTDGMLASDWHCWATQESPGATLTPTLGFAFGRPVFAVFRADTNNNRFIRFDTLLD